jgi:preprotein translocase subunit SecF
MIAGAYSSIFLATPMDVSFTNRQKKFHEHTELVLSQRQKVATELGTDIDSSEISTYFAPGQLLPGSHQGQHRRPKRNKRNK